MPLFAFYYTGFSVGGGLGRSVKAVKQRSPTCVRTYVRTCIASVCGCHPLAAGEGDAFSAFFAVFFFQRKSPTVGC